ncbi:hypothetical protein Emag_001696 [Eimeria magna]
MEREEPSSKAALQTAKTAGKKVSKGSGSSAPVKRQRRASARKQPGSSSSVEPTEEAASSAPEDAHMSSDSSSEDNGGDDELQFVGHANSDSDEDSEDAEKEVEASFELFDPQDEDAPGLLLLLRHARVYTQLGLQPQHLSALAEIIAGQGNIGSIARATTEAEGRSEAAVGLVSLLSVGQYPEATEPLVRRILSLAEEHASGESLSELRKLLPTTELSSSSKAGKGAVKDGSKATRPNACLFISSRYTNLPLEVAAEAAEALIEDVRWSLETPEMDEEERPWYRFTHVIGVTLIYRDPNPQVGTQKKQKQKHSLGLDFSPTFAEFEQEVLSEEAPVAFAAPTKQNIRFSSVPSGEGNKRRDLDKRTSVMQTLQEYLLVYALPYEQFELNNRKIKQRLALQAAFQN